MAEQLQIDKILALANSITAIPIDQLIVNPKWGSINFQSARGNFELIFSICNDLKNLPVAILPSPTADSLIQILSQTDALVNEIKRFSLESGGPPTALRDQIIGHAKQIAETLLTSTQSWIPYLAYSKGDVQKNIDALSTAVINANKLLETSKDELIAKREEIAAIVNAAREASASAGVGVFTSDFAGEASLLRKAATSWLIATIVLSVITLFVAGAYVSYAIPRDASTAQVIQYMTSKVVILAVLITATIWCGRIYKAIKHQETANKHRANALKTFQAFVKAADDAATRDAVLLEATRAIFSNSPSGYLDSADYSADAGTKVFEIFKGATSGVK